MDFFGHDVIKLYGTMEGLRRGAGFEVEGGRWELGQGR